jgi:hypothetical protein
MSIRTPRPVDGRDELSIRTRAKARTLMKLKVKALENVRRHQGCRGQDRRHALLQRRFEPTAMQLFSGDIRKGGRQVPQTMRQDGNEVSKSGRSRHRIIRLSEAQRIGFYRAADHTQLCW